MSAEDARELWAALKAGDTDARMLAVEMLYGASDMSAEAFADRFAPRVRAWCRAAGSDQGDEAGWRLTAELWPVVRRAWAAQTIEPFLTVGEADGFWLGYVDGEPMAKRFGGDPEPVADLDDFDGWSVQRFGLERLWVDPIGRVRDWK